MSAKARAAGAAGASGAMFRCGRGAAISDSADGEASEATSSLSSARISTTPSTGRFDRMTASGPRASRTLRRASREVGAVNFFTFIVGLRSCRQVLRQSVAIGTAGILAHSRIGLLTMPQGNHRRNRTGKPAYFPEAGYLDRV